MNDPLTSINAEEVEKNVMDAYKTMHKSVKIFSEIPSTYVARVRARDLFSAAALSLRLSYFFVSSFFPLMYVCLGLLRNSKVQLCMLMIVSSN